MHGSRVELRGKPGALVPWPADAVPIATDWRATIGAAVRSDGPDPDNLVTPRSESYQVEVIG